MSLWGIISFDPHSFVYSKSRHRSAHFKSLRKSTAFLSEIIHSDWIEWSAKWISNSGFDGIKHPMLLNQMFFFGLSEQFFLISYFLFCFLIIVFRFYDVRKNHKRRKGVNFHVHFMFSTNTHSFWFSRFIFLFSFDGRFFLHLWYSFLDFFSFPAGFCSSQFNCKR